jgi:GNAT superfamily N-acetyltransferase
MNRNVEANTLPNLVHLSNHLPEETFEVFDSNQHDALARLETLKLHDECSFEPELWQLALTRFNFELKGMERREEDNNVIIVALENGCVIGFLLMSTANSRLSPKPKIELRGCITFEVNITFVAKERRRRGIGMNIANEMLTVVQDLLDDETSIGFVLLKSTQNAREFWRKVGFSQGYPDDLIESVSHMKHTLEYAGYDHYIQMWYDDDE